MLLQDPFRKKAGFELLHFTSCCAKCFIAARILWRAKSGRNYVQKGQLGLVKASDVKRVQ